MASSGHIPLASQVGGHPGVLTTEDGSLVIKPALPLEVAFYQTISSTASPLRRIAPRFYGTLTLAGHVDPSRNDDPAALREAMHAVKGPQQESIVLENLQHTFKKPNVLDVKLGTILYDEDATPEKRARMESSARETTSLETGMRITGFQAEGKSLTPTDLPSGLAHFFPLSSSSRPPLASLSAASGSSVGATSFGMERSFSTDSTLTSSSTPVPFDQEDLAHGRGLPVDVLLPVLESIRREVQKIINVIAVEEIRMIGASLLIVYEADWERAKAGVQLMEERAASGEYDKYEDDEEDEEEEELDLDELEAGSDEEDEDEDDEDEEGKAKKIGPPFAVKLIDFAHTRFVPGKGPDEGVLQGLNTLLGLLDNRIKEVKNADKQ